MLFFIAREFDSAEKAVAVKNREDIIAVFSFTFGSIYLPLVIESEKSFNKLPVPQHVVERS